MSLFSIYTIYYYILFILYYVINWDKWHSAWGSFRMALMRIGNCLIKLIVLSVHQDKILAVTLLKNADNMYNISQLVRGLRFTEADIISDKPDIDVN